MVPAWRQARSAFRLIYPSSPNSPYTVCVDTLELNPASGKTVHLTGSSNSFLTCLLAFDQIRLAHMYHLIFCNLHRLCKPAALGYSKVCCERRHFQSFRRIALARYSVRSWNSTLQPLAKAVKNGQNDADTGIWAGFAGSLASIESHAEDPVLFSTTVFGSSQKILPCSTGFLEDDGRRCGA